MRSCSIWKKPEGFLLLAAQPCAQEEAGLPRLSASQWGWLGVAAAEAA
jgi:hypothetical protein